MTQLALLANPEPPSVPGIDLRCCDVAEVLAEVRDARLVHADPPWSYSKGMWSMLGAKGDGLTDGAIDGCCGEQYTSITDHDIAAHLDAAFDCAAPASRLVCWYTWPKAAEWRAAGMAGPRWGTETSGGAWTKIGQVGVGYHWRGQTEPVAVFTRGATGRANEAIINAHVSRPGPHSEKPLAWLRAMVRAWTEPGDLVLDLYAGLAPLARACAIEGRRYVGAEIDPERHRRALHLLALRDRERA